MIKQRRNTSRAMATFLAFALVQVCIQLSFAAPATAPAVVPQQFIARLTTTGNQPITVNNASAASGASLLTGATIETPAAVSATIDLGALGTVELQPNSSIQLDFDDSGNVRVKILRGCVAIKKSGPGTAESMAVLILSARRLLPLVVLVVKGLALRPWLRLSQVVALLPPA
jgi:UDP-3-O-[3-hydroxymyristoyl] glucosamine N-acyltransferase